MQTKLMQAKIFQVKSLPKKIRSGRGKAGLGANQPVRSAKQKCRMNSLKIFASGRIDTGGAAAP